MAFVRKLPPNDIYVFEDGTAVQNKSCITVKLVFLSKEEADKVAEKNLSRHGKRDEKLHADPE